MRLLITGSQGNIGRRLRAAFPGSIGLDQIAGADLIADLATIDYDALDIAAALRSIDAVVHLATSAEPEAPDAIHFAAVANTARLLQACERYDVERLVLPSSDWAEPKSAMTEINVYGHSKRVIESLAALYRHTGRRAVALRYGWVPENPAALADAPQWLLDNYWDDARLIAEVSAALAA